MEPTKLNSFFFVGKDTPENLYIGDIWFGNVSSSLDYDCPPMTDELEYPTHCPSCGAPVNSSRHKCEYYGVEYRKISYKS